MTCAIKERIYILIVPRQTPVFFFLFLFFLSIYSQYTIMTSFNKEYNNYFVIQKFILCKALFSFIFS
ncbi:MAG: hypothetical protein EXX96DRAFT_562417 [Benjaminiella poitrasii]|nr:MAG: hypothetical protein EXX96DRAFT_562417 [Benjaminiella poitrasii]